MPNTPSVGQIDFDAVRCMSVALAEKLDAYVQRHWKHQREVALIYQDLVDRLISSGAGQSAPAIGGQLPAFSLPDSFGQIVSSDELLSRGALIISFNRGSWCPFCRLELLSFAEFYPEVKELGGELVSIVPEMAKTTKNLMETYELPFSVLSDIDNGYSLANGLMYSCGEDLQIALLERGINLAELHGNKGLFMPITATYVVSQSGVVIDAFVNPDFRVRMPTEQAISALKSN